MGHTGDTTYLRYLRGKAAWNEWAEHADRTTTCDFSRITFADQEVDFAGFVFPGKVTFRGCIFKKRTTFKDAVFHDDADFAGCSFLDSVCFDDTVFEAKALFCEQAGFSDTCDVAPAATFTKGTTFNRATFIGQPWFSGVHFEYGVQFLHCTFHGMARLDDMVCHGSIQLDFSRFKPITTLDSEPANNRTSFVCTRFQGQAWFREVVFEAPVSFQSAVFENDAIYLRADFHDEASFYGVSSSRVFTLSEAKFRGVPSFIQTHFAEAPVFDDVRIGRGKIRDLLTFFQPRKHENKNDHAKWRALRRLAIQGQDHEKERDFFAGELWSLPRFSIRYWIGVLYWVTSRHGRSLIRPIACWAIVMAAAYLIYAGSYLRLEGFDPAALNGLRNVQYYAQDLQHFRADGHCLPPPLSSGPQLWKYFADTNAAREATNLALRNSFIDIERTPDSDLVTYGCLYGMAEIRDFGETKIIPIIPRLVSLTAVFQKILSGVMIFLFGLAIRNMLRIR